jgi:hypothetical protein
LTMKWQQFVLVIATGTCLAGGASAGIFFNKAKPSAQRAQELIGILKTDASESKRASAAEELGHYDGKTYPEIAPVLIEALHDSSASVRVKAVESLGKLRPVSQEAGMALEQVMANDSSTKVRFQARTTLWQYHLAGYHTSKDQGPNLNPPPSTSPSKAPLPPASREPPLAAPGSVPITPTAPPAPLPASRFTPVISSPPPMPQLSRPVPSSAPPLVPAQPPTLEPPPASEPPADGPALNAPK